MSSWTPAEIAHFERDLDLSLKTDKLIGDAMPPVSARLNLSLEADKLLDQIAERCHVGRSEAVRQIIVVGEKLLRTPYADYELECWHAIRAMRAQLGPDDEYRQEYHNG